MTTTPSPTKVVYVTGALGFIGSYVTRACLDKGWYVRGVDKITYAANPKLLDEFGKNDRFSFEQCDINDLDRIYDCDYVINLAAETHVDNSIRRSEEFIHSNIGGVHRILELLRVYGSGGYKTPTLLQFSTDEVYGDIVSGEHVETDTLRPSNPYSATKAAADMLILSWARTFKIPYIILRPTNNYGKMQAPEKLIPRACKCLLLGRKIPLHNNGEPYRNWLHAADTAQAVITLVESGVTNEIYNVAGGFQQRNIDTVRKIVNHYYGDDHNVNLSDYVDMSYSRPGQDVRYALNDSKLRALGWSPKIEFDKAIPEIVSYYKSNFVW
jgi:dTDP-glucose 4,6-dehydratase